MSAYLERVWRLVAHQNTGPPVGVSFVRRSCLAEATCLAYVVSAFLVSDVMTLARVVLIRRAAYSRLAMWNIRHQFLMFTKTSGSESGRAAFSPLCSGGRLTAVKPCLCSEVSKLSNQDAHSAVVGTPSRFAPAPLVEIVGATISNKGAKGHTFLRAGFRDYPASFLKHRSRVKRVHGGVLHHVFRAAKVCGISVRFGRALVQSSSVGLC